MTTDILRHIVRAIVDNGIAMAKHEFAGRASPPHALAAKNLYAARSAVHDGALLRADTALLLAQRSMSRVNAATEHDEARDKYIAAARAAINVALRDN